MAQLDKKTLEEVLDKRFEEQARIIARGFDSVDKQLEELRSQIQALSAKLTSHLELSDKRYLELKYKNKVITKWVKQIADKTGVEVDLEELEKF